MASFYDILIEMDTKFAQEQLENIETVIDKVNKESRSDPALSIKAAGLNSIPPQIKGLKVWIEQQKKLADSDLNLAKEEQQKKLNGGVGTQTSIKEPKQAPYMSNQLKPATQPQPTALVKPTMPGTVLKPPTTAKPITDILKNRNLTK